MNPDHRVAGVSTIAFAIASFAWFVQELAPPGLGYEDTDSPGVMVEFVRAYPEIHVFAGFALVLMSITLTVAVLGVSEVLRAAGAALAVRVLSALGLFAAAFFLVSGALKVGASGPLLHIAGLRADWGESAYLVYQVAGQALLISGVIGLCSWAVGLSLVGLRTRVLPSVLCALGLIPAVRLVTGFLGPAGLLPDNDLLWIVGLLSVPGTILWCLLLGLVLLRRGFGGQPAGIARP